MAESEVAPYLLTPLDNAMYRMYVPKILFFPKPRDLPTAIDTLRRGLTRLLEDVPLFSGTLKATNQKGGLYVTATRSTVEEIFQVKDLSHESGLDYEHLRSRKFPLEELGITTVLLPVAGMMESEVVLLPAAGITKSEPPVMLVQLNIIRGGMIMVMCVHHSFSDGVGTFAIAKAWASHCRGEDGSRSVTKEMLDRERLMQGWGSASLADVPGFCLKPHNEQASSSGILSHFNTVVSSWLIGPSQKLATRISRWIVGTKISSNPTTPDGVKPQPAVFFFSKRKLADLKSMASVRKSDEDRDVWISTNDALCALIGCCILSARDPQPITMPNRVRSIVIVVGMRRKLDPPLPENYIGNAMVNVGLRVPTPSMNTTPAVVSEIAYGLRHQIKKHGEPQLRKVIAALSSVEDLSRVLVTPPAASEHRVSISSWADQSYYELDWGDAVGVRVEKLRCSSVPGLCLILPELSAPRFTEDECGLEVVINLKKEDMERLKQNDLFMRFAQWQCN